MCITCLQTMNLPSKIITTSHKIVKTITRPVFHDSAWLDWDTELLEVVRDMANHIDIVKMKLAREKGKVPHIDLYVTEISAAPVDIEIFSETGWRIEVKYSLHENFNGTEGTHAHPLEKIDFLPLPDGVVMSDLPMLRLGEVMVKALEGVFQST